MPDQASNDAIVSMLRSKKFSTVDELANALAVSISGVSRQQTHKTVACMMIQVDANGGTILRVGDPSVGNPSTNLQVPQRGFLLKHGAVATRRQARVDLSNKTVAGMITAVEGTQANAVLTVRVQGDTPQLATDKTTSQLTPGGVLNNLTAEANSVQGTEYKISMVGTTFANSDDAAATGPELPQVGQTINVNVTQPSKKTTIWSNRSSRNYPRVYNIPGAAEATTVNGICCKQDTSGDGGPGGGS